ncbi:DUF6371 domain-containing protein [Emticicia agri]|uniref:Uncharacterized protein n=1 Tax=Emticicia agri TaxID=2492393 RepID=A0A4Q5LYL4_9BACT|nr:DUF6371 domain-containing protein [Emticicia agri]RYU94745.1 hypothetical protein EWM59_15550 [Emticicia agri]
MNQYQYSLDNVRAIKLFVCPACGKKEFKLYKNNETDAYLSNHVGKCNRIVKCNYHYSPKQFFEENPNSKVLFYQSPKTFNEVKRQGDFIASEYVEASFNNKENNFGIYVKSLFGKEVSEKLMKTYKIGTSDCWRGATIFWQIDGNSKAHTGKVILYNSVSGKRVKEPFPHISWVHTKLERNLVLKKFNLSQCLFGEHLINKYQPDKVIALVESEKTAVIASVLLPDLLWLAVGSLSNLTVERCEVLTGRKLILYPDLGIRNIKGLTPYDTWLNKGELLKKHLGCQVIISDLLEQKASLSERESGLDISDFLIRRDEKYGWALTDHNYPVFWDTS